MFKKLRLFFKIKKFIRTFMNVLISLIFFSIYIFICSCTELDPIYSGIIIMFSYTITTYIANLIYKFFNIKISNTLDENINPLLGNITLDFILKLYMPVLICDESGKIIWYNKALSTLSNSRDVLYGKYMDSVCDITIDKIMTCELDDGIEAMGFDSFFKIKGYKISSQGKNYYITVWNERTELKKVYKRISDEETIVAYIMIDNLEELLQYVQEKYRAASSEIEAILKKWSDSVGGILKEYERDKFLFIFESRYLDEFIKRKFDILDTIREIRVGEGSMPVTVSIGISRISGTLGEKERAAHASLDLALQRGGDQVVVKNSHNIEFYGGKTKTVQKRTKVRARVIANELIMLISRSENVLIMGHRYADFDSFGACIGIARLAAFCGVKTNIIVNMNDPNLKKCFDKLIGLPGYNDIFIDSVTAQDLIYSETLLVIVDVNNIKQFESNDIAENVFTTVIIDHHRKTAEFKNQPAISYIEPSASSTCELVSEMLEQVLPPGSFPKEEADLLFAGMLLDTKQFTRNTGVRTFSAALYLRGEGANPVEAQMLFKTNLDDFMREAKFELNVIIYKKIIAIALNESESSSSDRIAAAKAADKLLSVDGVIAAFALCNIDDAVHISARSSGTINVQLILEKLHGGGYYDAAGAQVKGVSIEVALAQLKDAIDSYLNQ